MIRSRLGAAAAGLLAAGMVILAAGPAMASTGLDPTTTSTTLAPCAAASSAPLYTAKCAPQVTGAAPGGTVVTLPGVGTLSFTVKPDGTIDTSTANMPTATATGANFSAGTPMVSSDGTHVTVVFINAATPTQKYVIRAKVSPPTSVVGAAATGTPTLSVVAGPASHHHHQGDHSDHESSTGAQHEHQFGQGSKGQNSQGQNSQGGGGH
jgi:hypothetical protein